MNLFLQLLVQGVMDGGLYVAVAIGFSLVWGILNIVNLAQGALVVLGAYIAYTLFTYLHVDPFLGLPLVAGVMFVLGYLIQRGVVNRMIQAPLFLTLLVTFGISLIVINVLQAIFASLVQATVTPGYVGAGVTVPLAGYSIGINFVRLAGLGLGLAMAAVVSYVLNRTRLGLAIQAAGADRGAAQLVGIDLRHIYAMTFGIGAATAGVAGVIFGTLHGFTPDAAEAFTLDAFVICVLGGLGRVGATVLGGMLFGLVEVFGGHYIPNGTGYAEAIGFGIMVLVLVFRPRGLLGRLA